MTRDKLIRMINVYDKAITHAKQLHEVELETVARNKFIKAVTGSIHKEKTVSAIDDLPKLIEYEGNKYELRVEYDDGLWSVSYVSRMSSEILESDDNESLHKAVKRIYSNLKTLRIV